MVAANPAIRARLSPERKGMPGRKSQWRLNLAVVNCFTVCGYPPLAALFRALPHNTTTVADPYWSAGFREEKYLSFVTTQPEALTAAASKLQTLGSSMAAQNAAAAVSITGVAPAAADEVSALQATQFSAYGAVYQQVSAQASAIHQMLVNTLGTSAGTLCGD
jgi:hypothetical protein